MVDSDDAGAPGQPQQPPHGRTLGLLLTLGAVLRVASLLESHDLPWFRAPQADGAVYLRAATSIVHGDWSGGFDLLPLNPGYVYFVALARGTLGESQWTVPILQALLGLGVVALTFDTARRLFGPRWAALPGALSALYGPYLFYESQLLAASLATFLNALLIWLVVRALRGGDVRRRAWLGIGVVWGLCAITRPNALLLLAPIVLVAANAFPARRWKVIAATVVGGLLAILPITARNLVVAGEPVLLTANGGMNFFIGNGPGANGGFRVPPEIGGTPRPEEQLRRFREVAQARAPGASSARAADAYWWSRTGSEIAQAPATWLGVMARKAHLFWNGRELSNVFDYEFMTRVHGVLGPWLVQFAWVAPWALMGTLLMLFERDPASRFIALTVFTFSLGIIFFFVVARYRLPIVPASMIAATGALERGARWLRTRRWGRLTGLALGVGVAVAVAWPVPVNKHFEHQYFALAMGWLAEGRVSDAERSYRQALRVDPDYLPAHNNLALLYERYDRPEDARREWRSVERIADSRGDEDAGARAREHLRSLASEGSGRPLGAGG